MKSLVLLLTDGPYISESVDMAYKIARSALGRYQVSIFLYLDSVHIPKVGQSPAMLPNSSRYLRDLAEMGARIRVCARCSAARGYKAREDQSCSDYVHGGIKITSLYDFAGMIKEGDRIISLSR